MKILIVYPKPDIKKKTRFGFSYDLLTIATILSLQHEITIRDYSCENYNEYELKQQIENNLYNLVLLECDSFALKRAQNLINAKEIINIVKGRIPIITYGNYCYITKKNFYNADHTIKENHINEIITLVNQICNSNIPTIPEYDSLPHIDRNLLFTIDFYKKNKYCTLFQTSKGCENTCVFCQRKGWQRHYIEHSDEYVLNELHIIKEQGFKNIWITDENFTFNLVRTKQILQKMIQSRLTKDMNLFISSWINIDEEFLDLAVNCNIKIISFGIESGSAEILKFYKKHIKLDNVVDIVNKANKKGIFTVGNFILGAPMETEDTIAQTFNLICKCQFDQINIKTLDYMIGSQLYDSLPEFMKTRDHIFACVENDLNGFSLQDLIKKKKEFQQQYYLEHSPFIKEKIEKFGNPYFL